MSKDQSLEMKKLALGNCRAVIDSFKAVLLDPIAPPDEELPSVGPSIEGRVAARNSMIEKKKAISKTLIHRLGGRAGNQTPTKNARSSTRTPPPAMKLICLGKQKVRIPANVIESTTCKQMRRQDNADD